MCLTVQAGTVVMGTSFPTPYEAVVDKTKGLSVRGLAGIVCILGMSAAVRSRINRTGLFGSPRLCNLSVDVYVLFVCRCAHSCWPTRWSARSQWHSLPELDTCC